MKSRVIGSLVREASAVISVVEPATEQVMAEVPRAGVEETDAAVAAAAEAFPAWRAVAPGERAALLRELADALESAAEELAVLEARNAGKPIGDARGEMGMVVETFRYYAGAPERLLGDTIPVAGGVDMTFREPLGVVGLIVPWNFPLVIASWKVAPALAAGNTIVLKPAELTPLTALELERIALERGPAGGRAERGRRAGQRLRAAAGGAPRRGEGGVHGLHRGRPRDRRGRRGNDQAGHARAGREVGQRGVRRRRPREGRRRGADGRVRQRGAGLLRALAHPRRALRAGPLRRFADRARGGRARGRPAGRVHADGPADLLGAPRGRGRRTCPATRPSPPGAARPTGPASGSRPPCWRRSRTPTARRWRRSSGRWCA